jgi:hypothetical protein
MTDHARPSVGFQNRIVSPFRLVIGVGMDRDMPGMAALPAGTSEAGLCHRSELTYTAPMNCRNGSHTAAGRGHLRRVPIVRHRQLLSTVGTA